MNHRALAEPVKYVEGHRRGTPTTDVVRREPGGFGAGEPLAARQHGAGRLEQDCCPLFWQGKEDCHSVCSHLSRKSVVAGGTLEVGAVVEELEPHLAEQLPCAEEQPRVRLG